MSFRAWLIRKKIRKSYRVKDLPASEMAGYFRKVLTESEKMIPKPPASATIEKIDEDGVRGEWVWAQGVRSDKVIFYSHGGGYVWGAPKPYRELAWRLSVAANARVFLLDYSLAPASQYPVQLDEAVRAFDFVAAQVGAENMTVSGDSAGGNLTMALVHALKRDGKQLPASIALISPWLDLTASGTVNYRKCRKGLHAGPAWDADRGRYIPGRGCNRRPIGIAAFC